MISILVHINVTPIKKQLPLPLLNNVLVTKTCIIQLALQNLPVKRYKKATGITMVPCKNYGNIYVWQKLSKETDHRSVLCLIFPNIAV